MTPGPKTLRINNRNKLIFYAVTALILSAIWWSWAGSSWSLLEAGVPHAMIAISRLAALTGTLLLLMQLVLVSRASWLEKVYGYDRLTRLHRWNGFAAFALISLHVFLIIGGNAALREVTPPQQAGMFISDSSYLLMAFLAYLILLTTVTVSVTVIFKKIRYEIWYFIHLFNYLMLFLALWHQVVHGTTLVANDNLRLLWYGLFGAVFINMLWYRFTKPVLLYLRHRFKVEKVVTQTDDTYSIYISGRNLDKFNYRPGQFGNWRFISKGLWLEEHPFTISTANNGHYLRITPKVVGDFTAKLRNVKPATPVILSGPLGGFTPAYTKGSKYLLVAGGIGVTPLRAIMEGLPPEADVVLIYIAKKASEFALLEELEDIAARNGWRIHLVTTREKNPSTQYGRIDSSFVKSKVPDVVSRAAFICGPASMMKATKKTLKELGVTGDSIHMERFSL